MLILNRRVGETVIIDDIIAVTVAAVNGDRVKLSFSAPDDIIIHRKEIWDAVEREKTELQGSDQKAIRQDSRNALI